MERAKTIQYLERHQWLIKAQSEGLSHDDSLLQLPFRGNCFNWVLGHVIVHRDIMLDLMNHSPVLNPEETALYKIESEPVTADRDAVDFEKLLELSRRSLQKLKDAILSVSDDLLKEIHNEERGSTIQDRIEFLIWHETYHLGQLEILRQLAGKDDTII
jgi:uncharacterized damage-inducible protein DinB